MCMFNDEGLVCPTTALYCFQREFERRAAEMGGGGFVVPAQTVTDFINNKLSGIKVTWKS